MIVANVFTLVVILAVLIGVVPICGARESCTPERPQQTDFVVEMITEPIL